MYPIIRTGLLFSCLWAIILITCSLEGSAQHKGEPSDLIIKEGEVVELKRRHQRIRKMVVKGTLTVSPKSPETLYVEQLIIDGGKFEVGQPGEKHPGEFSVKLTSEDSLTPSEISVINGGSLILNGYSKARPDQKIENLDWKLNDPQLWRSINIGVQSSEGIGYITIEDAGDIMLSGVQFEGLGVKGSTPSLSWYGLTRGKGTIENSVFSDSKYTDLLLDKTEVIIHQNAFLSSNGSSIICSPSGIGISNVITSNIIINDSNNGEFAIVTMNPYQSIKANVIQVDNRTGGIGIRPQKGYEDYKWEESNNALNIEGNTIERTVKDHLPSGTKPLTYGILIDHFDHTGIWRTKANTISGFDIGMIIKSGNVVVNEYSFTNNQIGIVPGTSYVGNSTISWSPEKENADTTAMALWITDEFGQSSPKVTNIRISDYPVGLHFEGQIQKENYFEKVKFENTVPLHFGSLDSTSYINDKDGSLFGVNNQASATSHSGHHGQHHQSAVYSEKVDKNIPGFVILPGNSSLMATHSTVLDNNPAIYKSPKSLFGVLTISTGFGMDDPVHEHNIHFKGLMITNQYNQHQIKPDKARNRQDIFLSANNYYTIDYGNEKKPLYDLSFEWDSNPGSWIILKVPYHHNKAYGMRAFGPLISPSETIEALENAKTTTYYIDEDENMVYVKLYYHEYQDQLVLYSSEVLTEIDIEGE